MNGRKLNWMNLNRESMRGNWCKMNWRSTIPFYLIMTHPNYSVEKKIQLYCWVSPPLPAKNSTIFFLLLHELNQLGINQCLIESPLIISYIDQQKKKKTGISFPFVESQSLCSMTCLAVVGLESWPVFGSSSSSWGSKIAETCWDFISTVLINLPGAWTSQLDCCCAWSTAILS